MRHTNNNKYKYTSTRTSRYGDARSSQSDATRLYYNEETETNQFSDKQLIRIDRAINRRRKRRRHWLETVTIALAVVTACAIVAFGGLLAFTFFSTADEPQAHTVTHNQDNESNTSESDYDGVNSYDIRNEVLNDGSDGSEPGLNFHGMVEYAVTDDSGALAVNEEVMNGGINYADISYENDGAGSTDDGNSAVGNMNISNGNHAQNEEGIVGGNESIQINVSERVISNFRQFDFFLESKLAEYAEFHRDNPELSYEYVVWKVNAGLNRDFFYNPYTITDAHPFLVNPFNRLPYDFSPHGMQRIDGTDMLATPETIRAFNRFQEYARTHGHDLRVASAYRSISAQRTLYANRGHLGTIARPGHSEHHTGRAIDLWGPLGLLDRWQRYPTSETALWVVNNAYRFGFIVRYTIYNDHITGIVGEPWHITYVTEYVSRTMRDNGYGSLEEFVARNPSFVFSP